MKATFELEGEKELERELNKLARSLQPSEVNPILLRGARVLADEAASRAPVGPTGNLKKSMQAKLLPTANYMPPAAIARQNFRKAPHASFVEYGSQGDRIAKKGKYKGRRFGHMKANPFFRNALQAKYAGVLRDVIAEIGAKLDKAMR